MNEKDLIKLWNSMRTQIIMAQIAPSLVLIGVFALVQLLQYKKVGKWSDYLRGEATYITLSLVAKSALAWQIFANTLIPPAS